MPLNDYDLIIITLSECRAKVYLFSLENIDELIIHKENLSSTSKKIEKCFSYKTFLFKTLLANYHLNDHDTKMLT